MLETPSRSATGEEHFNVAVHPDRTQVVVAPSGELDLATIDRVERELTDLRLAGFRDVVLDLRSLTFIDSSGLQLILRQAQAAEDSGCRFRLINGPASVRRLFQLTGTESAFEFVDRPR
jgi:anti-anti-sigma factor